jgi:hypothetical protein
MSCLSGLTGLDVLPKVVGDCVQDMYGPGWESKAYYGLVVLLILVVAASILAFIAWRTTA